MSSRRFFQRARIGATLVLVCLLAGLVAACGGSSTGPVAGQSP